VDELIQRLDGAVAAKDTETRCQNVKDVLTAVVKSGEEFIHGPFLKPAAGRYARRLLHRDPLGRYTIVVMVWDRGQATPLHDHAGMWCVECVYRGRIRVTSFSALSNPAEETVAFEKESVVVAGVGEAGALIPPFEYHMIENPDPTAAITIHVYGGDMTTCNAFVPEVDGRYRREARELSYTT
jgi:predicted metal-dependent enzyme (double-stranded beta helix superfamily)